MATRSIRTHNGGSRKALTPFLGLREEMDRLFDEWFNEPTLTLSPLRIFEERHEIYAPRVDVTENDKEIQIMAELPGLDEKDIDISVTDDRVILKGEKKEEHKGKEESYQWRERFFGSFRREIPLPCETESDKADAEFKKGILRITLPKTPKARQEVHRLKIHSD